MTTQDRNICESIQVVSSFAHPDYQYCERQQMLKEMKRIMKENTQLKQQNMKLKQELLVVKVQVEKLEIKLNCLSTRPSSQSIHEMTTPLTSLPPKHFQVNIKSYQETQELPTIDESKEQITQLTIDEAEKISESRASSRIKVPIFQEENKQNIKNLGNQKQRRSVKMEKIMAKYKPILESDDEKEHEKKENDEKE